MTKLEALGRRSLAAWVTALALAERHPGWPGEVMARTEIATGLFDLRMIAGEPEVTRGCESIAFDDRGRGSSRPVSVERVMRSSNGPQI